MLVDYRVRQREYLLAISRALTSELDLADVLRIIVQASVEFISGRAGVIVLADHRDRVFRAAAAYGIPRDLLSESAELMDGLPYEEGSEQDVIPELSELVEGIALQADIGLTQAIRLPMTNAGALVGMIYVFQMGKYQFSPDAPALLQSFADQAAIAVKNARLYQEVIAEKQRLDAIIEQSADGVMILDDKRQIVVFNTALSRLTGWESDKAIGCHFTEIIQWRELRTSTDLSKALKDGWPFPGAVHLYVEGNLARPNGSIIRLGITYAPVTDYRDRMVNIIANVRDLTRYQEEQELQKTFISVISHELKTPVSIIKGYAGTLARKDAEWSKEVQHEYLTVIEEEADSLTDLIDNLLEASRLQSGTFKLNLSDELFLPAMARRVTKKFESQTDRHTFSLSFPDDFPVIFGDERRITQVFNNLISNAIKYSPNGGMIHISGKVEDDVVTVSIMDEGIGIPTHQKHRIFQKFSRLENAITRKTEGSGLGLFLTRAIIEAHDGSIWFSQNKEDDPTLPGTTFTFALPRNYERETS